ncbi:hypothetical protein [Cesiribacter andamanensis]|uniref:Bacterial Pleckstrin homology domain-containing protein n=1 Tax=Cesiribacter andamanensis AMV16 TaxID=1279009 RepID=M7NJV0_9BACT|nr:hypothetical protein [Cesiribacter andamanensis]EMR02070.1 hypothetical protein ADICEAN_02816 [Cesiribacter andamanensis AMV16]
MKTTTPLYTETLSLHSKVIYWILIVSTFFAVGIPVLTNGSQWNEKEVTGTLMVAGIMALIWWLLLASRIKLQLDAEGVRYQFWPFSKKQARWETLRGWYVRQVSPFSEFGGWGMRYGLGQGWGYVTTSKWGLQLVYKDNSRVVISTRRPDELKHWLEQWAPAEVIETAER